VVAGRSSHPIGGDGLERDGSGRTFRQGRRERGAELGRAHPGGGQLLRHRLCPRHLVYPCARKLGQLGQAAQTRTVQTGVDQQVAGAAGPQQPPRGLLGPQSLPAGQVSVGVRVRVQAQHRCAPPAHSETDLRVELAGALGAALVGLGEQQLELAAIQRVDHDGVTVLVDQRDSRELVRDAHR